MLSQERGSTLLIVLFCLALGLVGVGFYAFQSTGSTQEEGLSPKAQFETLKQRVQQAISNPAVLNQSVKRNSNAFSCLSTVDRRCQGAGGEFLLFEGDKPTSDPLSQLAPGTGFTADGSGCQGFPSKECPIRVEAKWQPICASGFCENTNSMKIKVRVQLAEENQVWEKEQMFTPSLDVSEAVACGREGKIWADTECLNHEQAAERRIASGSKNPRATAEEGYKTPTGDAGAGEAEIICPNDIPIQDVYYPVVRTSVNRGIARIPAMNGCPAEDIFTFQCQLAQPDDREGQWIQVEAQMAPNCNQN